MLKLFLQEPVVQYILNENGNVVHDFKDFQRKKFTPPTTNDMHQHNKLQEAQARAVERSKNEMAKFFHKINLEDAGKYMCYFSLTHFVNPSKTIRQSKSMINFIMFI